MLLDADGTVVDETDTFSSAEPDLPGELASGEHFVDLTSSDGSGDWRAMTETQPDGSTLLVAVQTREVDASLDRLILIEVIAGSMLLALLVGSSWFVLRRELRPLETMADTAVSITGGDLSQRVSPADNRTEVGQLGLALNTMLGGLETSFAEQQATEDRLRQFLADASHELRTPLTSIRGFAELFRMGGGGDVVDRDTMVRRIEEESARMNVLVDDLLLLARLDQTRPAEREPVDLAVLAADACTDAVAVDPTRTVTLEAPRPVVVAGDRDHLRQAIANLTVERAAAHPGGQPDRGQRDAGRRPRRRPRARPRRRAQRRRPRPRVRPLLARRRGPHARRRRARPVDRRGDRRGAPGRDLGGQRPRRRRRVHHRSPGRRRVADPQSGRSTLITASSSAIR